MFKLKKVNYWLFQRFMTCFKWYINIGKRILLFAFIA